MAAYLQSRLILGAKCSEDTEAEIRKTTTTKTAPAITFMLFEVSVGHKVVNCCMSGGRVDPITKEPEFTLIGLASMEALTRTFPSATNLIFQEVKRGPTPFEEKIRQSVLNAPEGSLICFVGDMSNELNGFSKAFNPTGEPIFLNDFKDMAS